MTQDTAAHPGEPVRVQEPLLDINAAPTEQYQPPSPAYDIFTQSPKVDRAEQLAKALGWLGIGIGIAQLLAPRGMSRAIGVQEMPGVMRALGVREIASGIGILSQRRPANWLWTRVAGDAIDLAMLGLATRSPQALRHRVSLATAMVAGVALLDLVSSLDNMQRRRAEQGMSVTGELHVEKSIVVNRTPDECYRFWHDFESFPRFIRHVESVRLTGENRMHWVARGPAGSSVEWDAELIADEPGRSLAWRSLEGSEVDNAGTVRFEPAPGGRGTIVRVMVRYSPPGGAAGAMVAKMFGEEPSQQIDEDLRRFKWMIETGEIPTAIGQPSGLRGTFSRLLFRKGEAG